MHKTKWPLILKWKYGAYRAVFKVGHESTQFKLKNELLCDFIALLATKINGLEVVFLGHI